MRKYIQFEVFQNCLKWSVYINTLFSLFSYRLDYKNTTRVDLLEVDFTFHEDNHKVKEMTKVTSRDYEASFIHEQKNYKRTQRKCGRARETLDSHFLDLMVIFMERKIHFG